MLVFHLGIADWFQWFRKCSHATEKLVRKELVKAVALRWCTTVRDCLRPVAKNPATAVNRRGEPTIRNTFVFKSCKCNRTASHIKIV